MRHPSALCPLLLALCLCLGACSSLPRRVAIMDFENNTGEQRYDALSAALPEAITAYLTNSQTIEILERQDIGRYLEEIDSGKPDFTSRRLSRWQRLGERLGAEYLVAGSVARLDNNFILHARLFDVERGEVLPGSSMTQTCRSESELYYRVQAVAWELADMLRPRGAPAADKPRPSDPPQPLNTEPAPDISPNEEP